jgi:hypothetical protein
MFISGKVSHAYKERGKKLCDTKTGKIDIIELYVLVMESYFLTKEE